MVKQHKQYLLAAMPWIVPIMILGAVRFGIATSTYADSAQTQDGKYAETIPAQQENLTKYVRASVAQRKRARLIAYSELRLANDLPKMRQNAEQVASNFGLTENQTELLFNLVVAYLRDLERLRIDFRVGLLDEKMGHEKRQSIDENFTSELREKLPADVAEQLCSMVGQ